MPYSYNIVKDKNVKYILLKILDRISYQVDEFFVLERKNVLKWPLNEFFVELRWKRLDACYNDLIKMFFFKIKDHMYVDIFCIYYYGTQPLDLADLAAALSRLESNLARIDRYTWVGIELLDAIAEILIIKIRLPRSLYNYYRKRHVDKVIQAQ
jgi:hypothetical protein